MSKKFKVPLNLVGLANDPGSAANGDLYFNTSTNKVRYYTQNAWQDLGAAVGGAAAEVSTTIPATETEGKFWYDNDDAKLYVYDGTYWVQVSLGPVGPVGPGVPEGGTTGQVLIKSSNNDYATSWSTIEGGSGGGAGSVTETGTQTLTNKTIALGSNTITGTLANFNTALTDADFVSLTGSETLTNKTLTSPTLTGTPIAPTAAAATNTTQIATTAFVKTAVDNLVASAPGTLDTLNELATALGNDANFSTTITNSLSLKAPIASPTFTGTVSGITKTMVGLNNVDNTSDDNKPVSTATQLELNLKAPLASPTFTGTVSGISKSMVGLGNVDNTSDSSKPISTATQTALDLKANIASPTFTGTVSGITATMVGLGNVNNTSDANKPVSTATQTALDFKLDTADPAVDYYVTNSGSGAYLVNGVSNGTIYFERGKKYRIHVNASGHPFWIQTVSGGYSSANVYTTGITGSGTQSGHIIVELPQNAPQLYYACQYHSSMAGSIVTGTSVGSQLETKATFVSPINIVAGTTYTLVANDHKETVLCTSAAAVTVTIPPQSSVPWPAGSIVTIIQGGTGQVTVAAGSGVTLHTQGNSNARKTRYQHQIASLYRTSENTWMITGDLVIP